MIALALLVIAIGAGVFCYAIMKAASDADDAMERWAQAEAEEPADPDWAWPDPDPSTTTRKAHNDTEHRPS